MTIKERESLFTRAAELKRRNFVIHKEMMERMHSPLALTLKEIYDENQAEQDRIQTLTNTRREYLFNFIGGGWNSEWGYTIEEAISNAKEKYSSEIDEKTFRVKTDADYANLLSLFH